jgi:hypothetical protein
MFSQKHFWTQKHFSVSTCQWLCMILILKPFDHLLMVTTAWQDLQFSSTVSHVSIIKLQSIVMTWRHYNDCMSFNNVLNIQINLSVKPKLCKWCIEQSYIEHIVLHTWTGFLPGNGSVGRWGWLEPWRHAIVKSHVNSQIEPLLTFLLQADTTMAPVPPSTERCYSIKGLFMFSSCNYPATQEPRKISFKGEANEFQLDLKDSRWEPIKVNHFT